MSEDDDAALAGGDGSPYRAPTAEARLAQFRELMKQHKRRAAARLVIEALDAWAAGSPADDVPLSPNDALDLALALVAASPKTARSLFVSLDRALDASGSRTEHFPAAELERVGPAVKLAGAGDLTAIASSLEAADRAAFARALLGGDREEMRIDLAWYTQTPAQRAITRRFLERRAPVLFDVCRRALDEPKPGDPGYGQAVMSRPMSRQTKLAAISLCASVAFFFVWKAKGREGCGSDEFGEAERRMEDALARGACSEARRALDAVVVHADSPYRRRRVTELGARADACGAR